MTGVRYSDVSHCIIIFIFFFRCTVLRTAGPLRNFAPRDPEKMSITVNRDVHFSSNMYACTNSRTRFPVLPSTRRGPCTLVFFNGFRPADLFAAIYRRDVPPNACYIPVPAATSLSTLLARLRRRRRPHTYYIRHVCTHTRS